MIVKESIEPKLDPVIAELHAIKRQIIKEHNGDIDALFSSLRRAEEQAPHLLRDFSEENKTSSK